MKKEPAGPAWHELTAEAVLERLRTGLAGLVESEVQQRQREFGPNRLIERGGRGAIAILRDQFLSPMVLLLVGAGVVSFLLREYTDALAILVIVILNAVLGFVQEFRAERALQALMLLAVPTVRLRRDGRVQELPAAELVPGDIVLLEAGSRVPADGRLLEAVNMRVQEATLTGESEPVEKETGALAPGGIALGDRRNMVYMGTSVVAGRGTMVVTETGMRTELGRVADLLQQVEREPTPLQRRMSQLSRGLLLAVAVLVIVVFLLGLLLHRAELRVLILTAISMAVAAVPEALPAVVTIALALGAQRMFRRRALMRRLPAVETLGSVDVICSDKTGTLTENRMTVTVLDAAGHRFEVAPETSPEEAAAASEQTPALGILLAGGALCNDAALEIGEDGRHRAIGDPTEGALVVAAARFGLAKPELEAELPRTGEVCFSSERRRMTTVHQRRDGMVVRLLERAGISSPWVAFCKGAVDSVLEVSASALVGSRAQPLDRELHQRILSANDELAAKGMRVLAVAMKPLAALPVEISEATVEDQMTFVGLVAMIDPARPDVKAAVATCRQAGIRPVMITGDHPLTAQYIARGLDMTDSENRPLTGVELANVSAEQLEQVAEETAVYARVAPEQKLAIVEALQRRGHIVAMTGDGVNDAPALRKADIGVAMGITGTDISKEAADMVLLDDNFATIVAAVEEGRVIFDNIRKFLRYTLTSNAGEIWVMLLAPLAGMPMALLPVQILWVNLMTDGLPGLALTVEPAERDTMRRKPYHPSQSIFGRGLAIDVIWVGLLLGVVAFGAGWVWWQRRSDNWQTMVFTVLTLGQMANALATRSETDSFFSRRRPNHLLYAAVLLTFGLQLAVTYVPFLQKVFHTRPLAIWELVACLGMSGVVFCMVEFGKMVRRRVRGRE